MNRKKVVVISIITFVINFGLDRLTKIIAVNYLKGSESIHLLYDSIIITYAENTGAFLSMGSNWPVALKYLLLLVLPIALCLYGIFYCLVKEKSLSRVVLYMSIISGGLGNLIDRLLNDFTVVDFLNFGIGNLRTGILNVADMSVTFSLIILLFYEFRQNKKKDIEKETKSSSSIEDKS